VLPKRVHFIPDFFRAYQQPQLLFDTPFTPESMAALKPGFGSEMSENPSGRRP
jgi:hypothetical protein